MRGAVRPGLRATLLLVGLGVRLGSGIVAQEIQLGDLGAGQSAAQRQHVTLETDAVQVKAGKPDWLELRFRVNQGMHINSHDPKDELLVATVLDVNATTQLKLLGQEYPAGVPLRLDVGGGEVLSTYQGEFRVLVHVLAQPGQQPLAGILRYQACDARSCFPPKSLPVQVIVTAK